MAIEIREATVEEQLIVPYPKVELKPSTHILNHPLIEHKITVLRDERTSASEFRRAVEEITTLMCYESMRNLELEDCEIVTPICSTVGKRISGKKLVLAPIMRAGNGMEPAAKAVVPQSRTGFIGLYRDEETLQPVKYF